MDDILFFIYIKLFYAAGSSVGGVCSTGGSGSGSSAGGVGFSGCGVSSIGGV